MKKLIFLLLLAQTISFLYGDAACMGYRRYQGADGVLSDPADKNAWRWGIKSLYKIRCDCPCMHYKQLANHKCIMCGHTRVPEDLMLSGSPESEVIPATITITTIKHKHPTHAEKKAVKKAEQGKKNRVHHSLDAGIKKANKKLIGVTEE